MALATLTNGPLVYIDDDEDNHFIFERIINELNLTNQLRLFQEGEEFLSYLQATREKPLLILCDLNMGGMSGLELKHRIDTDEFLRMKAIPFIFYTALASPQQVTEAYKATIQGFHLRPTTFTETKEQINLIVRYWQNCLHPNSF
ncbi:response regulator [Larkinella terrae]|uniref:Response regulator n=1 Tax=Larkinella terrae TaxID=2025311 RepID=A0A7K0EUY6_9BACT|nr:response regulator [Larkinella terrae]MRS65366.1 response regulator [Larkinella terrae]